MRKMKDSGIEWIGEIPEDWEVSKLKPFLQWKSVKGFGNETVLSLYRDFGILPKESRDDNHNVTSLDTDSYKLVEIGDFVINKMKAWQGSMAISNYRGIVSPAYHVCSIKNSKIYKPYFHYLMRNKSYLPEYERLSSGLRIGQWDLSFEDFCQIKFIIPSFIEQQRIADFLDDKVSQIDSVISKTRETIEEYKKLKHSIITEVVTGKVKIENGKVCGKYDTYKDSGIEWIGEIPSEWEVLKTLYTLKMPITDGPHETPELLPDGIPFISAEAVSCGNGHIDFSHKRGYISREYYNECCKKYVPQLDDIYMIKSGATTGKIAKVETTEIFTIWSPLAVFRFDEHIANVKYMFFYLQSDCYQKQIEDKWTFGTQQNIGMRTLEQLKLILPSLHEQQQIADFLNKKCSEIDKLITKKEQLVVELEAYKKSLIYEVVTGKRSV